MNYKLNRDQAMLALKIALDKVKWLEDNRIVVEETHVSTTPSYYGDMIWRKNRKVKDGYVITANGHGNLSLGYNNSHKFEGIYKKSGCGSGYMIVIDYAGEYRAFDSVFFKDMVT